MKRTVLIILGITWIGTIGLFAEEIKISYFVSYPHIIYNSKTGKIAGTLYEMLNKHIGPAMKANFVWDKSPSPIPRQLQNLGYNKVDALALLAYTPDRASKFSYTKKHFFESQSGLAVRKDSSLRKVSTVEDVLGLRIGYAKRIFVTPFMRDERIKFDLISSSNFLELNIRKLLRNRIQAAYSADIAALLYLEKNMSLENELRVVKLPERPIKFHVLFAKQGTDKASRFDKAFTSLGGADFYLKLLNTYFDTSKL